MRLASPSVQVQNPVVAQVLRRDKVAAAVYDGEVRLPAVPPALGLQPLHLVSVSRSCRIFG